MEKLNSSPSPKHLFPNPKTRLKPPWHHSRQALLFRHYRHQRCFPSPAQPFICFATPPPPPQRTVLFPPLQMTTLLIISPPPSRPRKRCWSSNCDKDSTKPFIRMVLCLVVVIEALVDPELVQFLRFVWLLEVEKKVAGEGVKNLIWVLDIAKQAIAQIILCIYESDFGVCNEFVVISQPYMQFQVGKAQSIFTIDLFPVLS
ncbi:hypothetical protein L1887_38726 [Cichorium endivia]|nr:hypothetical protein L1887_38726 [Cichorium endivia]